MTNSKRRNAGSVRQNKSGTWSIRFIDPEGARRSQGPYDTEKLAREALEAVLTDIRSASKGGLATGDGAVMLWRKRSSAPISAVSFPVSPTRLLVLGDGLDGLTVPLNTLMSNCRGWLVDHVDGNLARVATFR